MIYYTILVATMLVATMCRKLTDYHVITDVTTDDNTAGALCHYTVVDGVIMYMYVQCCRAGSLLQLLNGPVGQGS